MSALETGFEGFVRQDGSVGIRNTVLVLPSVICSRIVAERIADRVPAARAAPHDHGCGQIGADKDQTARTFLGIAANPNVSGTVVVGLGCESIQSDAVAAGIDELDRSVRELSIQGAGGTDACIERGVEAATDLADGAESVGRQPADLGDLTLGIVSSDAAASTVDHAAPAVGAAAQAVVEAGGRVLVAGTEQLLPHRTAVLDSASDSARNDLATLFERHGEQPSRTARVSRQAAEHEFASLAAAWGDLPIADIVDYGDRATHDEGVAFVDAPAQFEEAGTGLAAAGATLILHVTADGVPTGHPIVPTVKVSAEPATLDALAADIDVDARSASTGAVTETLSRVADGERSRAERHGLTSFAITRVGPSM